MSAKKSELKIFFPVSRQDFVVELESNQRYRNSFGDKRIEARIVALGAQIVSDQTVVINQLNLNTAEKAAAYNVLNNKSMELAELINYSTKIPDSLVVGREMLVLLDTSSVSLKSKQSERKKTNPQPGVVENNSTPGFFLHPSLVVDKQNGSLIGMGDVVVFDRPKNNIKDKKENNRLRTKRAQSLPLADKESCVWSLSASNTQNQLSSASEVTYVMDRGGDHFESLAEIEKNTGGKILVRSKINRSAIEAKTLRKGKLTELLADQKWESSRNTPLKKLDHLSKTHSKRITRPARNAELKIRQVKVDLCPPSGYNGQLLGSVTVVEVQEDASTVPAGGDPIYWRLITTRKIHSIEDMWEVVDIYRKRWLIEQLFRVSKKKGLDIEHSQFKDPNAIKKQAILGLVAAFQALQLTMARSGEENIPIETVFNDKQQIGVLNKLNDKLSGRTEKTTNPHKKTSLAWAAWIVAMLGGWSGYQKGRKPGPITMHRGLKKLNTILWANQILEEP